MKGMLSGRFLMPGLEWGLYGLSLTDAGDGYHKGSIPA